jgi:hypothetical protein
MLSLCYAIKIGLNSFVKSKYVGVIQYVQHLIMGDMLAHMNVLNHQASFLKSNYTPLSYTCCS